jgi:hypothetical protein
MLGRLSRWTLRARAPRLGAALWPAWFGLLFVVVEVWTIVDWPDLAARIDAVGPLRGLPVAMVLVALSRQVGAVGVDPPFRRLLPRGLVGLVLLPTGIALAGPALAVAVLFPGGPLLRLVGWAGIALWAEDPRAWIPLAGIAVLGEALGPARLFVDIPLLLTVRWRPERATSTAGGWRPRSAFGALVGRDLLCLWRTSRQSLYAALAAAPLPAVLVWGLRRNGHLPTADLARAVAVLLCLVSPVGAAALGRLHERLGPHFRPRHWPVSGGTRLVSLVVVFALVLLPTHAAMAATGGIAAAVPPLGHLLLLGSGAAWLVTRPIQRVTWYPVWAAATLPLALGGHFVVSAILAVLPLVHAARRWS